MGNNPIPPLRKPGLRADPTEDEWFHVLRELVAHGHLDYEQHEKCVEQVFLGETPTLEGVALRHARGGDGRYLFDSPFPSPRMEATIR